MEQRLGDLLTGEAYVERGADVDAQLWFAAAERGQGAESDQLTTAGIQAGAIVDVPEREGGDMVPEGGVDVGEGLDDGAKSGKLVSGLVVGLTTT